MFDRKEYMKIYNKKYYTENREREKVRSKKWIDENSEKQKEMRKQWYQLYGKEYRKNNIEKIRVSARKYARKYYKENSEFLKEYRKSKENKEVQKRYRLKHRNEINKRNAEYMRKRFKIDANFRFQNVLRIRILHAIQNQSTNKAYKSIELLGCSIDIVRKHIEKQFSNGMNWQNHGKLWEIDHITPISSFDLTEKEEQKKAFNYTNLQPLIKWDNRSKGSKIPQDKNIV